MFKQFPQLWQTRTALEQIGPAAYLVQQGSLMVHRRSRLPAAVTNYGASRVVVENLQPRNLLVLPSLLPYTRRLQR